MVDRMGGNSPNYINPENTFFGRSREDHPIVNFPRDAIQATGMKPQ